jgi:hypothetical protein
MTDDELVRRYEALRLAVAAVLEEAAADETSVPPAHRQKLDFLEQALNAPEARKNVVTREVFDPDLHLLSMRDYDRAVPGGAPFSLVRRAESIRRSIALDDAAEHPVGEWPHDYAPALTELQAMVVASLLQELAARLTATGESGQDLAAVALELADEVLAPTFVGAQG